jgi:uncharacterized membrane protein YbjE (DUF340 family)
VLQAVLWGRDKSLLALIGIQQEPLSGPVFRSTIPIPNFIKFVLSIPILGGGIWLANRESTDCKKFLEKQVISIGVFFMVVSIIGLIGVCYRVS